MLHTAWLSSLRNVQHKQTAKTFAPQKFGTVQYRTEFISISYSLQKLPPVRGQGPRPAAEERDQKKRKKKRREVKVVDGSGKDGRIRSFDYRAWDKFDVVGLVV